MDQKYKIETARGLLEEVIRDAFPAHALGRQLAAVPGAARVHERLLEASQNAASAMKE